MKNANRLRIEQFNTGTANIIIELGDQDVNALVDWSYEVDSDYRITITIESVYSGETDLIDLVCADTLAEQLEQLGADRLDLETEYRAMQSDYYYDRDR